MAGSSGARDGIDAAARAIREAYRTGVSCPPVRELLPAKDLSAAYAVQEINTTLWLAEGRRPVGRKIGLTSKAVQKQLGVDQPDFGMLYADMCLGDGDAVPAGAVLQPKAEAEIALVLDRDLTQECPTFAEILRAVGYVLPAIEIVGSRIANWQIDIVDTIADNASSGMFVLGGRARRLDDIDLTACAMTMYRADQTISSGGGRACLGHPLNAAVWLAGKMVEIGRPLLAGDIIMSGALGPMVSMEPGDMVEASIEGLGSVFVGFER